MVGLKSTKSCTKYNESTRATSVGSATKQRVGWSDVRSGVRCATSVKTPPQVIVGCGYLTDVIISLSMGSAGKDKAPPPVRFRKEGSRSQLLKWHGDDCCALHVALREKRNKARNVSRRRIER